MKKALFAAGLVVFATACASQHAIEPLHYSIDNNVLQFEYQGALYVVTDSATVESARNAAQDLLHAMRGLNRSSSPAIASRENYDRDYAATTASGSIAPAADVASADRPSTEAARGLYNDSMGFADDAAETGTRHRRLEDDAARATKRLQKIFTSAVQNGLANRAG